MFYVIVGRRNKDDCIDAKDTNKSFLLDERHDGTFPLSSISGSCTNLPVAFSLYQLGLFSLFSSLLLAVVHFVTLLTAAFTLSLELELAFAVALINCRLHYYC